MKKLATIVLSVLMVLVLTACSAVVDLSEEIKPTDCSSAIMDKPEDMMKILGITEGDLIDGVLNKDGSNVLKEKVNVLGHDFDMSFDVYDEQVQRYAFTISKADHTEDDRKIYIDLLNSMVDEYGDPDTDDRDGRRYQYNTTYYNAPMISIYEEWNRAGYDIQLIYSLLDDNIMNIHIVVVVHVDLNDR